VLFGCCVWLSADDVEMGCHEMISKRYISDEFCTSVRPVTERVCTGHCVPVDVLPWYSQYVEVWARSKPISWRCVERRRRTRRVKLRCDNGQIRRYPLRVVSGCRCKRVSHLQDRSGASVTVLTRGRAAASRRDTEQQQYRRRKSRRRRLPKSSTDST